MTLARKSLNISFYCHKFTFLISQSKPRTDKRISDEEIRITAPCLTVQTPCRLRKFTQRKICV